MRRRWPITFTLFVTGGLLSALLGVSNLALLLDRSQGSAPITSGSTSVASASSRLPDAPSQPHLRGTPSPMAPAALTSSAAPAQAAVDPAGWSLLYVVGGDLWLSEGGSQLQLTQGAHVTQPTLTDDALAFVERVKNASDIWLASTDTPLQPVTHNTSSVVSQNHWATQPVFVPGRQRLYVIGDFNKSSTGTGNLAVWQVNLQEQGVVQITQPPEYGGGDQDITVNPHNPRQIIFTRYSYSGTQLQEQLQWMDVSTSTPTELTPSDQASRQASFSPDGTWIAFTQAGHGTDQNLWVARIQVDDTGAHLEDPRQVATGTIAYPVWSPDGNALAYIALTKEQFQVWSLDLERGSTGSIGIFGQARQVTSGPSVDATSRPVLMTRGQVARVRDWLTMPAAQS